MMEPACRLVRTWHDDGFRYWEPLMTHLLITSVDHGSRGPSCSNFTLTPYYDRCRNMLANGYEPNIMIDSTIGNSILLVRRFIRKDDKLLRTNFLIRLIDGMINLLQYYMPTKCFGRAIRYTTKATKEKCQVPIDWSLFACGLPRVNLETLVLRPTTMYTTTFSIHWSSRWNRLTVPAWWICSRE